MPRGRTRPLQYARAKLCKNARRGTRLGLRLSRANGTIGGPGGANGSQLLRIQSGDERLVIMGTAATRVLFRPPAGQIIGGFRRFEIGIRGASADARAGELRRCILIASSGRARLVKAAC